MTSYLQCSSKCDTQELVILFQFLLNLYHFFSNIPIQRSFVNIISVIADRLATDS